MTSHLPSPLFPTLPRLNLSFPLVLLRQDLKYGLPPSVESLKKRVCTCYDYLAINTKLKRLQTNFIAKLCPTSRVLITEAKP